VQGTVVGDDRTAMEAAIDSGPLERRATALPPEAAHEGLQLAPNAPDSYVVKRGDTLWGIAKVFLRDPWYWPEIWQVNPQVQNPHLIYPGDTCIWSISTAGRESCCSSAATARASMPRVRSQPLEAAVTTIPYETVAAFMSKPSVLEGANQDAPYVLSPRAICTCHVRRRHRLRARLHRSGELGTHYNVVRVGDALRDPDDNRVLGYDGVYTGTGHVTRGGDPATLIMTESTRETDPGDKLFPAASTCRSISFRARRRPRSTAASWPSSDGVTIIGQYEVVVINRGARDGLAPGNVLAVYSAAIPSTTTQEGLLASGDSLFAKKVQLPDERTGTFMVFKTFDRMSYGLIMEATDVIRVADKVQNP
jgi:hypothetical protein